MNRRSKAELGGITAAALILSACGDGDTTRGAGGDGACESQTVKLAHKYPTTHYFNQLSEGLADEVSEATDGEVTVDIFPAEQLVPEAEEIASTASNAVQITMPSTSEYHDYDIPADVTSLPFAIEGFEETRQLRGSEFEEIFFEMIESVESVTVHGSIEGAPVDVLATTGDILKSPAAFEGLKLRANNASVGALFEAYGSPALTQPVNDVYTSLERGTIDGGVTIVTALVAGKWYEPAPNITVTPGGLGYAFYPIISNRDWYEGLCADHQTVFDEAFANTVENGQELAEQEYADGMELLKETDGVNVYEVPVEEQEAWASPGEFLYDEYKRKWGERGAELLESYQAVGD